MKTKRLHFYLAAVCLLLTCFACRTVKTSETPRTAIELLLLSRASDEAFRNEDLSWARGKKAYVEDKYFDSYDKGYVISLIRNRLSESGALLMANLSNADIIVELRSAGLGINSSETLLGLPSMNLPIPLVTTPLETPELAFYKNQKEDSIGKFAMFAYARDSGEHVLSFGPVAGYAHFHLYKILGVSWMRTDVPQLRHPPIPDNTNIQSKL